MKYEKLIYGLGSMVVIAGAIMKTLHLPYANAILFVGFMGTSFFQTWLVTQLKKRIKELERKS